jgi:hypothetical protein
MATGWDTMTAEYNERGFHFLYPENWELVVDEAVGWPRSVSVHAPSGAFWSATADSRPGPELLDRVVDAIAQEYEEVERDRVERTIGDVTVSGIELHFYCLDLLISAQVLLCPTTSHSAVIIIQAESREFERLAAVFDAISFSYLQRR